MSEPLPVTEPWQPYREPLCATLLRTGTIALIAGLAIALSRHSLQRWAAAALLALWPSFGGHWVELFFLNIRRPKLPPARAIQIPARLATWFTGGVLLAIGVLLTARAFPGFHAVRFPIWIGGVAFIGIELTVHAVMSLRGIPNFYNGRG